ncbi:MAG: outer membrane beta-barrel protein [Bacteroidales bacterium]|nr:outer membrane beta-barrel protein [Bacteroidales bacterium]
MKKQILLLTAFFLIGTAFAQEKLYLSLGVGGGFGTAASYDFSTNGDKAHPVALGKGFDVMLRGGYFVNDFMAVELGVGYRKGFNTKINLDVFSNNGLTLDGNGTLKISGNMLEIVPALVISPNLGSKTIRPYTRLGVIIGVMNSINTKDDETILGHTINFNLKYSGGVVVGGSAALGADFNLGKMFSLYAEIIYDALSYAPTKGKFTKFEADGVDMLPNMKTCDKEVKFVKDLTGYTPQDGEPSQELKNSYPFNSLGLNIGVKIKLGNK